MNVVELRPARSAPRARVAVAIVIALSLSLGATSVLAQPMGTVQIKGKRYVDGEESKVKCMMSPRCRRKSSVS